ncbi:TOM1-like protein 6 [Linum perenne]
MASSSSATVAVDKATSDLLITPDWTMNIDICDSINSNHWQAKDVVKAVKKRLQHKNPRVQFLALTLLETMVKNCGDFVHFQIAEKNLLGEMVKIVKKKTDIQVRDKVLVLLDSWQEAFGGPGGRYSQYYWAYEELRRSGVRFPPRALNAAPIFTPPLTHSTLRPAEPGYGMPGGSSRRLDETMATEIEGLSLSSLESMRDVMELLGDMLQAVNPGDREAVKEEVIVDLVEHCRSNQKKLVQMLTTTGDEEVLVRGLELNDSLQILLAKHDAIASGLPIPMPVPDLSSKQTEGSSSNTKPTVVKNSPPRTRTEPVATSANPPISRAEEDEEEEEEEHSKSQPSPTQGSSEASRALVPIETSQTSSDAASSFLPTSNALAVIDPVKNTQEQDIIDLLSITLSTDWTSQPNTSQETASTTEQSVPQIPVSSGTQAYPGSQGPAPFDSYVVPWAQPQPQPQPQHHSQPSQAPSPSQSQPQPMHYHQQQQQFRPQFEPQMQSQFQSQQQYQYPQYSSAYPPPPWAVTPGYANGSSQSYVPSNTFSMPHSNSTTSFPQRAAAATLMQQQQQQQNYGNSSNGTALNGDPIVGLGTRGPAQPAVQKPFVPSYRLFEDLNVLGSAEGKFKVNGSTAPSLSSSTSGQSMVGGRK